MDPFSWVRPRTTACATAGAAIGTTEGTTDLGSYRLGPVMPIANTTATTIAIIAITTYPYYRYFWDFHEHRVVPLPSDARSCPSPLAGEAPEPSDHPLVAVALGRRDARGLRDCSCHL